MEIAYLVQQARAKLTTEEHARDVALTKLADARVELAAQKSRLREQPTPQSAEQAERAQAALNRAELLAGAHHERVANAQDELRDALAREAHELIKECQSKCSETLGKIAPVIDRAVALERELWTLMEQLVETTDIHEATRQNIRELAARVDIQTASVLPRAISLDLAIAMCQAAISRTRLEEGRKYLVGAFPWMLAVGGRLQAGFLDAAGRYVPVDIELSPGPKPTDNSETALQWREAEQLLEIMNHV